MLAVVLAVAASVSYGTGDFLGGSQSRRTSVWTVLIVSQFAGMVLMGVVVAARGHSLPAEVLLPGIGAGLLLPVVYASYYQALAIGVMGIIAPICALSAAVPLITGLVRGERPSLLQMAGIAVALAGVIIASAKKSAKDRHHTTSTASILLAVLSAAAWGFIMVFFAQGAETDPYWSVALSRATSVAVFTLAFIVLRPAKRFTRAAAPPIIAAGMLSAGGNALFSVSSTLGYLSVVSVLSSIYPLFVMILAYAFLHERLSRLQQAGVVAALVGVALISAA